jgi:iron complex outermembrane receptor protein
VNRRTMRGVPKEGNRSEFRGDLDGQLGPRCLRGAGSGSLWRSAAVQSVLFGLVLGFPATPAWAQKVPADLTEIGIEKLMDIEITSVSKKEQKLFQAAAAIFVITAEDIRRSGAMSISDLLRMAPGVEVAQVDANAWAISIRGFNERNSDKVLVLIDGRTVYTPSFSGVYWDQQDVPLEDIERIEVIRGPGGTVWGANAVNGVINIITKNAQATLGGLLSARAGSEQKGQGLIQYGGKIRQDGAYRVFGNFFNIGNSSSAVGGQAADGWHLAHGGFRSDWNLSPRDALTVQGDLYNSGEGQTITELFSNEQFLQRTLNDKVTVGGGNILGRWRRTLENGSDMSLQIYYDHYNRHEQGWRDIEGIFDLDFHHHLRIGSRHDVVWGFGYRVSSDRFTPGYDTTFFPPQRTDNLFSTFFQDQVKLTKVLSFTLGAKFEHNAYTGFEYEPSAQLAWTPTERQTFWVSAAKAIEQPSRSEKGIRMDVATIPLQDGTLGVLTRFGNPQVKAEQLHDYEAGYRVAIRQQLSWDVAAFSSYYQSLGTSEPRDPFFALNPQPPHLVFPLVNANNARAHTYGGEVFANWSVTSRWRISPGFSIIRMRVSSSPLSKDTGAEKQEGDSPKHRFQIRSFLSLPHNLEWDSSLYWVGGFPDGDIPPYARLDTRLGWRWGESAELSLAGQNLLQLRHSEFENAGAVLRTMVQRSVYAKITWRF